MNPFHSTKTGQTTALYQTHQVAGTPAATEAEAQVLLSGEGQIPEARILGEEQPVERKAAADLQDWGNQVV